MIGKNKMPAKYIDGRAGWMIRDEWVSRIGILMVRDLMRLGETVTKGEGNQTC